ncbi:hypothetical protein ACP_1366 [Acidobacterium capsulatum ATCC 51196]|uniref:Uncharacterized protein n=1 Tax=Acidobacterium capsulatum (strain ATCC 51196 / DSM 11244 / BCRC 80197 / JCM 7670 / NBRC 15755 / NCIMB 13165 / 161) TaxID=240015 RepID=C1F5I9_ACIC5|nr:hypothetical protein ACP_1366 [Acidobacterium capsulatum ATCC 51196]
MPAEGRSEELAPSFLYHKIAVYPPQKEKESPPSIERLS